MAANTYKCTTDLMAYMRFKKSMHTIATEVSYNYCISDVLGERKGKIHEYEVKISIQDMKRDFYKLIGIQNRRVKKADLSKYKGYLKHEVYNSKKPGCFVPHYFYFVVPPELEEAALKVCKKCKKYGVLVWDPSAIKLEYKFRSAKRPSALNKEVLNKRVVSKIIKRASSELINLRMKKVEGA